MQGAAPTSIELHLVGTPRVRGADGTLHPLERKDAALLALLALDGPTPRARATALLWPDVGDTTARGNLRQRLFRLRRLTGSELIASERDVLSLAAGIGHDLADDVTPVGETASAPRAELLGAFDYTDCDALNDWLLAARTRRRDTRHKQLVAQIDQLRASGQIALALQVCAALVGEDPLREDGYRHLMRLHAQRGDRAAALAAFERCRSVLARELEVAPSAETLALATSLLEPAPAAPDARQPVAVARPPRLVGRDREWQVLEGAWQANRVAVVIGEAGVGKTRLLSDFAAAHCAPVVGCRPDDTHVAHALIRRLLSALLERGVRLDDDTAPAADRQWARRELGRVLPAFETAGVVTGDIDPVRLALAVQLLLAAAPRTDGLEGVVIDDLQFADAESLQVLALIARGEPGATRWLIGLRPHELPDAARHWLGPADAAALTRITLRPLDADSVHALLATLALQDLDLASWAPAIHRHTGGNVLFILETLRAVLRAGADRDDPGESLPVPARIEQLIAQRVRGLSTRAQELAHLAAIAGTDFGVESAAVILATHPLDLVAPWQELEDALIIRDDGFAHDLVLEAIQRAIPAAARRSLHAAIAAQLVARGAPAARAARHWKQAGAWHEAANAYVAAAQHAFEASRRAAELAHLRAAADCLRQAGGTDAQHTIELRSARAALLIDRADQARAYAQAALAAASTTEQRADAHAVCAEVSGFLADSARSVEFAAAGLQEALAVHSASLVLRLAGLLGRLHAERGELDVGLGVFTQHEPWLTRGADAAAVRAFLMNRAQALHQSSQREQAVTLAEQALASAETSHEWADAYQCHSHLSAFKARLGRTGEALDHLRRALALREELGAAGGQTEIARFYLGVILVQLGRYAEAFDELNTALTRLKLGQVTQWAIIVENVVARIYEVFGQPGRALQLLSDVPPTLAAVARAMRYINQARVLRALGKARGALVAEALALYARHRQHDADLMAQLQQAIDSGAQAGAELAAGIEAQARERAHLPLMLDAQVVACACLLKAGAVAAAAQQARAMLALSERTTPWTAYPAEIFWTAHQALAAAGDDGAARAALERARQWVESHVAHVPPAFRDSFLNRNPINRAIVTAATRAK